MSEAQIGERTFVVTVSKTLRSKGQCRQELFAAAHSADRIFGAQIKMCTLFGLRRKEATHLRPEESDEGTRLRVYRGTKGGKSRYVAIETPEQREALDEAKAAAASVYAGGALSWPRRDAEQALERFRDHAKAIGLTAAGRFQTTPHGLRHEFACDKYFRLTGHIAQVESGLPVDPQVDREARKVLAQELGHGRVEVCGAYIGSNRVVVTEADLNQKALHERFQQPQVRETLQGAGITCLRMVGKVAAGALDPAADTFCAYEGMLVFDKVSREDLEQLLAKTVGSHVFLTELTDALRARVDGLEVL